MGVCGAGLPEVDRKVALRVRATRSLYQGVQILKTLQMQKRATLMDSPFFEWGSAGLAYQQCAGHPVLLSHGETPNYPRAGHRSPLMCFIFPVTGLSSEWAGLAFHGAGLPRGWPSSQVGPHRSCRQIKLYITSF